MSGSGSHSPRTRSATRLIAAALLAAGVLAAGPASARQAPSSAATPGSHCGPGSMPETGTQGRVPAADYADGRAAKGYTCNTKLVSHVGSTGGYKVLRYVDKAGHVCGFYDTTLLFPKDTATNAAEGLGEYVLDMHDPA